MLTSCKLLLIIFLVQLIKSFGTIVKFIVIYIFKTVPLLAGKYSISQYGFKDRENLVFFESGAIEDLIPATRRHEFLTTVFSQAFSGIE